MYVKHKQCHELVVKIRIFIIFSHNYFGSSLFSLVKLTLEFRTALTQNFPFFKQSIYNTKHYQPWDRGCFLFSARDKSRVEKQITTEVPRKSYRPKCGIIFYQY